MEKQLHKLQTTAIAELNTLATLPDLEAFDIKYLGRKQGELTNLLKGLKDLSPEERKTVGEVANEVKKSIEEALTTKRQTLEHQLMQTQFEQDRLDITEPPLPPTTFGHLHPTTQLEHEVTQFFSTLGFTVIDGPELESDYYNFTAVNVPPNHPARDMQDTFYIKDHPTRVMRTHTSSVQVRAMQKYGAPLRAIVPGRCFRNEATDPRHEHTFNQLEGVVIDKNIAFADLKGLLELLAKNLFGEATKVRLRPKFYPFVEPGVNGEVTCFLCKGIGCRVCKKTGWLEVLGAGMIHPNVLKEGGIDSTIYQGFAFGLGFSRLVMLKYGITDARDLLGGNLKLLQQF